MRDAGMDQGRSHFDRTYGSGMVGPPRPHNTGCFRLSRARTFRRLLENIQLRSKKNAAANPKHGTTAELTLQDAPGRFLPCLGMP